MPRDNKDKKNKSPFATDLSEHCKSDADVFQNQFTKFSREKTEDRLLELNNGESITPPPIRISKDLIKGQSIALISDDGEKKYEKPDATLIEVLSLIDTCPSEDAYVDNHVSFSNPFLGGITLHNVSHDSWMVSLVINKNLEILTAISFDEVSSDMAKILAINFFDGDFVGEKYTTEILDDLEIKALKTKFRKVQEEYHQRTPNCSYCLSSINCTSQHRKSFIVCCIRGRLLRRHYDMG